MASPAKAFCASDLVDLSDGHISREIFVNDEIYAREQEQIFARVWLFVGHESQVAKPGDYFVSCMGEESVILCRDRAGQLHVFLNSCRHRGMKVCRYDEGNTPVFTCPYHGWSYAADGSLVGVPYFKDAYHEQLDKSKWGLVEVAQLENYKGTIWATWDKNAPPFTEFLGEMKVYLDLLLDSRDGNEGGSEIIGGVQKWTMPCNWKFPAENFAGDAYHNISHRSVDIAGIGPSGRGRRDTDQQNAAPRLNVGFPDLGHAAVCYYQALDAPYQPSYQNNPTVEEYFRQAYLQRREQMGEGSRLLGSVGTVFPHMSFLARQPRSIAVWHPRGSNQTEAWRWFLVDKDTPEEVKEVLRHYYIRYSGPGGMTEQDDMENWNYAQSASRGTIARRHPYNYEMGLDNGDPGYPTPGRISLGITEGNQRSLYQRWVQLMDADGWDHLTSNGKSNHRRGTGESNSKVRGRG